MRRHLDTAIRMTILTAVLLGLLYPLAVTGVAQVLFPGAAHGSLVRAGGRVVGSAFIAQGFTQDRYFWPRPSAAGDGYDAMASAASNLGPTNKALIERVGRDVRKQVRANRGFAGRPVPVDMVTTSGSGLDPHITVANARAQAARVAEARGLRRDALLRLIDAHTAGRTFMFLGEPRINVLELNLVLDQTAPWPQAGR